MITAAALAPFVAACSTTRRTAKRRPSCRRHRKKVNTGRNAMRNSTKTAPRVSRQRSEAPFEQGALRRSEVGSMAHRDVGAMGVIGDSEAAGGGSNVRSWFSQEELPLHLSRAANSAMQ